MPGPRSPAAAKERDCRDCGSTFATTAQDDFVDNLCGKLLAYALGRSLMLSDDLLIQEMRSRLGGDGYRFETVIESIVTSRQFLNKRGREQLAANER